MKHIPPLSCSIYYIIYIMKQMSGSKDNHYDSLNYSKYVPNPSYNHKSAHSRPNFLRYKTADTKPNNIFLSSQELNPQNNQKSAKICHIALKQPHQTVSPKSNNNISFEGERIIRRLGQKKDKNQNSSHRKNSTPLKIRSIYEYICPKSNQMTLVNKNKFPRKQYQTNKKLIQKLLSFRCTLKVVSQRQLHKNGAEQFRQSQISKAAYKIQSGFSQNVDQTEKTINLSPHNQDQNAKLVEVNCQQNQSKQMGKTKKIMEYQNNSPYSNRQIYTKVRNGYKRGKYEGRSDCKDISHFSSNNIERNEYQKPRNEESKPKRKLQKDGNLFQIRRKMISQQELKCSETAVQGW